MKTVTFDDTMYQLVPKEPTTPMINAGECGCMDNDVTLAVYRRMLSAAPTPPAQPAERKPQEWMPIETAPKDGTEILVLTKQGNQYVVSYDDIFSAPWRVINDFGLNEQVPTHWMPLPAAPETGIKGES